VRKWNYQFYSGNETDISICNTNNDIQSTY